MRPVLWIPAALSCAALFSTRCPNTETDPMATAASAFLATLGPPARDACTFPFDDPERVHWQPVPFGEAGVRFSTLDAAQRSALRALLESALSAEGLATVDGVRVLEGILVELEAKAGTPSANHGAERYFVSVYGDPGGEGESAGKPWGWRFEGHHLSLSFTVQNGHWTAHGPIFFGAQPAHVHGGAHDGLQLLAPDDDPVRALVRALPDEQRARAIVQEAVPGNVLLLPGEDQGFAEKQGLCAAELDDERAQALLAHLRHVAGRLRPDLADAEFERMRAGLGAIHLSWRGSLEPGAPHYWRIDGEHFVLEYAAPERDPDHVHYLWRDPQHEFGGELLREHLREHAARGGR